MAKTDPQKPKFPSKPCPHCSTLIHARAKSHPACGWVMAGDGKSAAVEAPKAAGKPAEKATAAKPESANGKPANKREGVEWAVQHLGKEAKPLAIQEWLREKFKIKMPISTISNYKSLLVNKGGRKQKAKAHKGGRPPKAATPMHPSSGGAISLDDIRAVKALADRIGAEKVRELALVLTK